MKPIFIEEIPEGRIVLVPDIPDPVVTPKHPPCNFCLGSLESNRPFSIEQKEDLCLQIPCTKHGTRIGIFEHELEEYKSRALVAKINRAGVEEC